MARDDLLVIVGCGRLGSFLADRLSQAGSSVVVVDIRKEAFSLLSPDYSGFKIEGDAGEVEVLRRAKLDKAGVLMAVTGDDNLNIFVSQWARRVFGVPRAVARIYDIRRQQFYCNQQVETLSPTAIVAEEFLEQVQEAAPE